MAKFVGFLTVIVAQNVLEADAKEDFVAAVQMTCAVVVPVKLGARNDVAEEYVTLAGLMVSSSAA